MPTTKTPPPHLPPSKSHHNPPLPHPLLPETEEHELTFFFFFCFVRAQVVGWPPVRAYRKNTFQAAAVAAKKKAEQQGGLYVKVSMDGAPYLRKVDLKMYKGYRELREALDALFTNSVSAAAAAQGGDHQHALAYEDKDGDLMLVGDVPWSKCHRIPISCSSLHARSSG
ncbi:hypothetical protein HU200_067017 [Digitaria exilis]|uniref:Auxin-responsive protein n=1 Tax=Digitaria exilis TaxID=1010633 RepID=A0A835DSJ1_9POAL|nr:hypothetical protein HU200_067017 [Digitaria exilis]